jgi:hypothetical protein
MYQIYKDKTLDNVDITNDLTFDYSFIDVGIPIDTPETITFALVNTFEEIPISNINTQQNASADLTNNLVTMDQAGAYISSVSLAYDSTIAIPTFVFGIGIDGNLPIDSNQMSATALATFDYPASFKLSCFCNSNSQLKLYVKNITNTDTIVIRSMHWITKRI